MILLSAYINSFGKFKNFEFSFNSKFNEIDGINGYGKTTLATFLKVMLFGMGSKKSVERTHFAPLSGSDYGGVLTLKYKNDIYKIVRIFGINSSKNDTILIEKNGKQISFIGEIGEVLLGIDKETFERLFFIDNNDLDFSGCSTIKNFLFGATGEGEENIISAIASLEDYKKKLINNRKNSNSDLMVCNANIKDLNAKIKDKETIQNNLRTKYNNLKNLKSNVDSLSKDYNEALKLEKSKNLKDQYLQQKQELENAKKDLNSFRSKYNGNIISEEDFKKIQNKSSEYNTLALKCENNTFNDKEEEKFNELKQIFDNKDFESDKKLIQNMQKNLYQLNSATYWESCLQNNRSNLNSKITYNQTKLQDNKSTQKNTKNITILVVVFMLVGLISAVVGFINLNSNFAMAISLIVLGFTVFGAIFFLSMLLLVARKPQNIPKNGESDNTFSGKDDYKQKFDETVNHLKTIFKSYNKERSGKLNDINDLFDEIKDAFAIYKNLCERRANALNNIGEYKKQMAEIVDEENKTLRKYGLVISNFNFENFKSDFESMNKLVMKINIYNKAIENMHIEPSLIEGENSDENSSSSDLKSLSDKLTQARVDVSNSIREIRNDEYEINDLDELKNDLDKEKERLESIKKRAALVNKTIEFLNTAKKNVEERYIAPIQKEFDKYFNNLETDFLKNIKIDSNLNIYIKNNSGLNLTGSQLSNGQKTICAFCLRVALLNNIFKDSESPFIILDDPFVSLDENNLDGIKPIVKDISAYNQIIYFTCHESRKIDK